MADWWGRHVWIEHGGIRRGLRYCGDPLAAVPFVWGRAGIGARELSRAVLFDATGSAMVAERFCREFTHTIVARLPEVEFVLDRDEVLAWLGDQA